LNINGFYHHIRAYEIKERLPEKMWDSFFKFGFVRNPWDYRVSLYNFVKKNPNHPRYIIAKDMTFKEFLIFWNKNKIGWPSQKDFFYNDDKCLVDFIGRFENLEQDFQAVCDRIGIKAELLRVNSSKRKRDYRQYYTPETRDLVARYFKEDIEVFEYEF
jgi:hypothetical protein